MRRPIYRRWHRTGHPVPQGRSLDEPAVKRLARRQIDAGVHFLSPCGTTGEAPTLNHREKLRVVELVLEEANGRVPVLAGAGGYDTREVIELARDMERVGVRRDPVGDAVLQQADAGRSLSALQGDRREHPRADGALQRPRPHRRQHGREDDGAAVGDPEHRGRQGARRPGADVEIISATRDEFILLSGDDPVTVAVMAVGGAGVVSVASNEAPPRWCRSSSCASAATMRRAEAAPLAAAADPGELRRIESHSRARRPWRQWGSSKRTTACRSCRPRRRRATRSSSAPAAQDARSRRPRRLARRHEEEGHEEDRAVPVSQVDPVSLTRSLVDIDSTTGREARGRRVAGGVSARPRLSRDRAAVADGRFNVLATLDEAPRVALSTHFDCVPPFFPSREERGLIFGRGACDAKGILAAQVAAAERVRAPARRASRWCSSSARSAAATARRSPTSRRLMGCGILINGEPTDIRLGAATRGALRVRLTAPGAPRTRRFPSWASRRSTSCSTR